MQCVMRFLAMATLSLVPGPVVLGASAAQAQTYQSGGILRVGAFAQMSAVSFDIARVSNSGSIFNGSTSPSGLGGGIVAGYDLRLNPTWLVGIEVDGSLDNGRSTADSNRGFNSDSFVTVRGRLGFNLTRNWLLYGTAGYGLHGTEFRGLTLGTSTSATGKTSSTQGGLVYGGGTEYDLDSYTLFAEVLQASFDTWGFVAPDVPYTYKVDDSALLARVGVKFKIGYDYDHDITPRGARRY